MTGLDLSEWVGIVQTIGIIGSLGLTLYFASRQMRAMNLDVESRVLNDLDEKRYRLSELFLEKPELMAAVAAPASGSQPAHVVAYMVALVSAHAFHMRERGIISDNEWDGWYQWIRNDFTQGSVRKDWTDLKLGQWFDPSFRQFIERDILVSTKRNP